MGLLLCVLLIIFGSFLAWQYVLDEKSIYKLAAGQWLIAFAAILATLGWCVTAWVAIKNSVKQHTINTLLQSRLSKTYMDYADAVNKHFGEHLSKAPASRPVDATQGIDQASLRYILNYFEYIALGIRYGDLHEGMLQRSLFSIIGNTTSYSKHWIDAAVAKNDRTYCHLRWLMNRWFGPDGFKSTSN
nr:DUF4760 domain-containing protein [Variovorax sp. SG517]